MGNSYPNDWAERREKVFKRDQYTCQNCVSKGGSYGDAKLNAHHSVPNSKGGSHRISNLITHCTECHNAIHGRKMAPTADDDAITDGIFIVGRNQVLPYESSSQRTIPDNQNNSKRTNRLRNVYEANDWSVLVCCLPSEMTTNVAFEAIGDNSSILIEKENQDLWLVECIQYGDRGVSFQPLSTWRTAVSFASGLVSEPPT